MSIENRKRLKQTHLGAHWELALCNALSRLRSINTNRDGAELPAGLGLRRLLYSLRMRRSLTTTMGLLRDAAITGTVLALTFLASSSYSS
jgi:hypothetical protein